MFYCISAQIAVICRDAAALTIVLGMKLIRQLAWIIRMRFLVAALLKYIGNINNVSS